ncbi:major intrinsically disordered Notch2-binding receptor 1-like [Hypomesus transpacificus]|uniref:major intrinsically disordered Notch2-binding receptor 1-like n=1 Tax=Hypomesus transpacificus TaxID=137520 RepID=UPI001F0870CA|nr:major intrinsically disordered Notch2-binding receptor 1-like [Hypomesus transpacificus]
MANLQQEYPLVLLGILEELANMRHWLSFQDLCRMVSTRFDLKHLVELRSLLFSAACRDSCFPATLFRDRVTTRGLGLSPIGVAADIVTIFNLIQMTGSAGDETHPMRSHLTLPVDQSPGPSLPGADDLRFAGQYWTRAHSDSGSRTIDQRMLFPKFNYSVRKRGSLPPDPISLVSSPPARARAVSFDWPHNTPLFSSGRIPGQAMQSIYLPLETDSESSTQDSLSGDSAPKDVFETGPEESCVKRRDIFKKDFHNQSPLIPQVTISSDSPSPRGGDEKMFTNHSFEVLTNPYPSPTADRPSPERRAKHESFDDQQDSTYFGPAGTPEWSTVHLQPPRSQKTIWTEKSMSVDSNVGSRRALLDSNQSHPSWSTPTLNPGASSGRVRRGKYAEDEVVASKGTQTDPPDPRRLRSLVHADRLSFMTSLDDPDMMCEDDISAIFRFLDDMSVCGSTGVLHPHDGGGGPASQDTHEARRGRLGQLQRLFHSLESSDDGVKASVCKLLLRMSQIERQLESLSEVKAEISQVLSALRRLDEKIQDPSMIAGAGVRGRWLGPLSAGLSSMGSPLVSPNTESSEPQPLSVSGHLFPGTSSGSLDWNKWNVSGEQKEDSGSQNDIKGGKGGKKGILSRRASKSQSEEKSVVDSKRPSGSNSARDWAVSFSKNKDGKAIHGKTGQMEQTTSTSNLLPSKPSHLVEQVFNSALFRQKGGGLTSGFINDPRLAEGGPVWTVGERISPLDLQARESLNPNNMDFWMEDIYTPGYDALLRRKEADLRRAKVCKVGALIATAVTIILVIVIPLCTMKS